MQRITLLRPVVRAARLTTVRAHFATAAAASPAPAAAPAAAAAAAAAAASASVPPTVARPQVRSAQLRAQRPRAASLNPSSASAPSSAAALAALDPALDSDRCGPTLPQSEMVSVVNEATGERMGPRGLEPTRYGDWEAKGRCWDF